MRKNELIKILQEIKGNPEIVLWNGMVSDWMHISKELTPVTLTKYSWEGMKKHCLIEDQINRKDFSYQYSEEDLKSLRESYLTHHKWEYNEFTTEDAMKSGDYKKKTVFVLQAKPRGISAFDRLGGVSY